MKIHLHKNATTTPAQRAFIQADSHLNSVDLAQKLGVSPATVRKWKKRDSVYDRSHVPHQLPAVLTPLPVHPDDQGSVLYYSVIHLRDAAKTGSCYTGSSTTPGFARELSSRKHRKKPCAGGICFFPEASDSGRNNPLGQMKEQKKLIRALVSFLKHPVQRELYSFDERR